MRVDPKRLDLVTLHLCDALDVRAAGAISDRLRLLRAIADVESSYGTNNNPRHEPAYCRGGRYHDEPLTSLYGCAAHCSYGPWQIMYPTARELGFVGDPDELASPETCCLYAVRYLNARARDAKTIEDCARCFNGGNINATAVPRSYIDKLVAAYRRRSQR